jgi:gelsolin
VFIADTGKEVFVWIGSGASVAENKNAMSYAHNYLMGTKHPLVPVTCIKPGQSNTSFDKLF